MSIDIEISISITISAITSSSIISSNIVSIARTLMINIITMTSIHSCNMGDINIIYLDGLCSGGSISTLDQYLIEFSRLYIYIPSLVRLDCDSTLV